VADQEFRVARIFYCDLLVISHKCQYKIVRECVIYGACGAVSVLCLWAVVTSGI